ncbi:MAG: PhoH family protein [Rhodospirillales bacterium]|nr:PhoH family protein [Rhodospirillales bacterium]
MEKKLNVDINTRGNEVVISGAARSADQARRVLEALWSRITNGQEIDSQSVDSALRFLDEEKERSPKARLEQFTRNEEQIATRKKTIRPRSPLQAGYIEAMYKNKLTFGIGPAGTGKTYLAVAMAVAMLEEGAVERIILSRPAVEAGERLGFLPGEMKEKMDPYMRPLYDALHDTMAADRLQKKIASEEIEIAPLAFMRGRTLNNAFIILDEAQNTTSMQMLMFLTRIGEGSRMVITGDPGQTDLPRGERSGLLEAQDVLAGGEDMAFINFTHKDVVRSSLVAQIIQAYDKYNKKRDV